MSTHVARRSVPPRMSPNTVRWPSFERCMIDAAYQPSSPVNRAIATKANKSLARIPNVTGAGRPGQANAFTRSKHAGKPVSLVTARNANRPEAGDLWSKTLEFCVAYWTLTVTAKLLLFTLVSGVAEAAVPVLVTCVPAATPVGASTLIPTSAEAPTARSPRLQLTVPAVLEHNAVTLLPAPTKVSPAGSVSLNVTLDAAMGPLFLTWKT